MLLPMSFQFPQPTCPSQERKRQQSNPIIHRKSTHFHGVRVDFISVCWLQAFSRYDCQPTLLSTDKKRCRWPLRSRWAESEWIYCVYLLAVNKWLSFPQAAFSSLFLYWCHNSVALKEIQIKTVLSGGQTANKLLFLDDFIFVQEDFSDVLCS